MTEADADHFEMRRLELLSNTIFGVAMTLLAYDLPRAGQFTELPSWSDLYNLYGTRLSGMILSFIIAGIFWFSHQRRLARQPLGNRNIVFLNLLFLLSIIFLPVTNGLNSSYRDSTAVATLFGLHLTLIATLNALLWWQVHRDNRKHSEFIGSVFPILVFVPGTLVALVAPHDAQYVWLLAFGALFVRRFFRPTI